MITWVRLWHDMPTDPKFRSIARAAKQPLTAVVAVYVFMLTDASANAAERGRTQANDETIASALDLDDEAVAAIRKAMQGRVLDGGALTGWEKRQPKREDGSPDRAKVWRDLQKANAEIERLRTQVNAAERNRPLDKEERRGEEEKKEDNPPPARSTTPGEEGGRAGAFSDEDLKDEGLPEGYYETAERLRTAFRERGLDEPEMSRVAMWLEQGHTPATIVAVVRERLAASKAKPRGLSYFDRALAEAKPVAEPEKREAVADPGSQVFVKLTDPAWEIYAAAYRATKGKSPPVSERHGGWYFPADLIPAEQH